MLLGIAKIRCWIKIAIYTNTATIDTDYILDKIKRKIVSKSETISIIWSICTLM